MTNFMVPIQRVRPRLMVQHSTLDSCVCSEDHFVYRYHYATRTLQCLFRLSPASQSTIDILKDRLLRNGVVRFFRRNIGIENLVELPSGTMLAFYDKVYRYVPSRGGAIAEASIDWHTFNFHPPLKNGIAVHPETQCVYFGEYGRPAAAKIMRLWDDGTKAEICYTFPKGAVKHVHTVTWDAFRKRLWIATGDADAESALYYTDDDFRTVSYFNGGSQTWRMVSLLPTEEALYWGTEAGKSTTENDINRILRWNFTGASLETLCEIGNPAYYSVFLDSGGMLIGATYEPGLKQPSEHAAELWYSAQGDHWEKICALPYKDLSKAHRTQFATLHLPTGVVPQRHIMFTPVNTARWDFDLLTITI